jgi:hypothetical protein
MDTPRLAPITVATSVLELWRAPASTPSGTPTITAMNSAAADSWSVTGSRSISRSVTGWRRRMDSPRSPLNTSPA